jgi:hypothetical protein
MIKEELSPFLFTKASIRSIPTFVLPKPVQATIVATPPDFIHFLRHSFCLSSRVIIMWDLNCLQSHI